MNDIRRTTISENRDLSTDEVEILTWLLENGTETGKGYIDQMPDLRVVSKCSCGCASIDFDKAGSPTPLSGGMEIVADFAWTSDTGSEFGIFVFARSGLLRGLEVWSVDGLETPTELPAITELRPMIFSNK